MALTRSQYLEHFRRAIARVVTLNPEASISPILEGMLDYVTQGTYGTQAERLETAYIIANLLWQDLLGQPYNGHRMKHWVQQSGVPIAVDIPNIHEPLA
jgi:hypothetical protein